jgi:hypothetical protein
VGRLDIEINCALIGRDLFGIAPALEAKNSLDNHR